MQLGKGINNLGNTCYIASVLQCLRYSKRCVFQLREHDTASDMPLIRYFVDLLYAGSTKQTLNAFVSTLALQGNQEFKLLRQCDAHELYLVLTDTFYTKHTKYTNPFMGKLRSTVECTVCHHNSITENPFVSLSLEMKGELESIETLITNFLSKESLEDKIECDNCKEKQISTKQLTVSKTPDILVVHLKRFTGLLKNTTPIGLKQTITVNDQTYSLYAMVNHSGGLGGGHYTAACKKRNGNWIICNDELVTDINRLPTQSSQPYMLFYTT